MGLLFILLGIAALVLVVLVYNSLIGRKNQADSALASIDVILKKRHDLIPNLVATVEKYMTHEQNLLSELTELRARLKSVGLSPDQRVSAEGEMDGAIERLLLSAENYPDLKASQNFLHLQGSLNEVEEQLSAARRAYNAAVTDFNNAIQMFPGNLLAGPMGMTQRALFESSSVEHQNIDVRATFQG